MNEKAASLIGADIPMHEKLGRYTNFDPRPDIPFAEQLPVMSLAEKVVVGFAMVVCFCVLVLGDTL